MDLYVFAISTDNISGDYLGNADALCEISKKQNFGKSLVLLDGNGGVLSMPNIFANYTKIHQYIEKKYKKVLDAKK